MSEIKDDFDINRIYQIIPKNILKEILMEYPLDLKNSFDGINHIARVVENGILLSEINRTNLNVIIVFSFFHSIKRKNNEEDVGFNERSANFLKYYEDKINLSESEFEIAYIACRDQELEIDPENAIIADCWDAERLDSMRRGIYPNSEKLNSFAAKNTGTITWAMKRGLNDYKPEWVDIILQELGV